jgi:hypothetical protein
MFQDYGAALEGAGFGEVEAVDNTSYFMQILKGELSRFRPLKAKMTREYSEADYNTICEGWEQKLDRCGKGDQVWGYFKAKKMYS